MLGEVAGFDEGSIAVRAGERFDSVVSSLKQRGSKETKQRQRGESKRKNGETKRNETNLVNRQRSNESKSLLASRMITDERF